jgi:hypothetical protein
VAVGSRAFVERVQDALGPRALYRRVSDVDGLSILRDGEETYRHHFGPEISALTYFPHVADVIWRGFPRAGRFDAKSPEAWPRGVRAGDCF